ncbi:MAG: type II toxin-antitoxin system VapC family toxin [Opitutales bacterium]|nr:type II toxin-antitoxin system VapC family toxin [Opitutales bacterium]
MIAVDANVITYLVLKGDYSKECEDLFVWDPEWVAPRLWRDELCNVLVTYERRGMLDRKNALQAFSDAEAVIGENQYDVGAERILSVADRTQCSGYDSQYIALAEDLGIKLFTFDKKVLLHAKEVALKPGDQGGEGLRR